MININCPKCKNICTFITLAERYNCAACSYYRAIYINIKGDSNYFETISIYNYFIDIDIAYSRTRVYLDSEKILDTRSTLDLNSLLDLDEKSFKNKIHILINLQ